jgi:hypothetical protein
MKLQVFLLLLLSATTGLFAADPDYPSSYREMGLPEYENASVTGLGRDNTSLRDGIAVTLFTQDDGATLRAYYEAEMQNLGWTLQETVASKKMRAAGMLDKMPFGAIFSKDGMRYQLFTNPEGNGIAVHINISED